MKSEASKYGRSVDNFCLNHNVQHLSKILQGATHLMFDTGRAEFLLDTLTFGAILNIEANDDHTLTQAILQ